MVMPQMVEIWQTKAPKLTHGCSEGVGSQCEGALEVVQALPALSSELLEFHISGERGQTTYKNLTSVTSAIPSVLVLRVRIKPDLLQLLHLS